MEISVSNRLGAAIRDQFPIFEHSTYLNSCSQGALSHRVRQAYEEYLNGWDEKGAEWSHWAERAATMRSSFARLLNAGNDEIAITTSVSQGVSGIVSALRFDGGERKRIVISDYEFPAVAQIAHAQELRGAEVVHVHPEPDGSIPPERFAELIDERTALVCCATVSFRTGHRQNVAEISRIAHEHGALCLADSYQAAGAIDLDVRALGVDFVTGGTVKYLLGSPGLGFLYVRGEILPRLLPTQTGWWADEDVYAMDISDYSPAPDARRFDAGTPPVPNIYGGVAGISLLEEVGTALIEQHVDMLASELIDDLESLNAKVITPRDSARRGPLVCIRSTDVNSLVAALAAERILVSSRDHNLRIALHLYNSSEDISTVVEALARNRHLLA